MYEQYIGYVFPLNRLGARTIGALSCWRLRDVSSIIVPTRKVEDVLRGYGLTKPIHVVPTGIDLERHRLPMTNDERVQRRLELGIGADAQVVINLGRMGMEKNLERSCAMVGRGTRIKEGGRWKIIVLLAVVVLLATEFRYGCDTPSM